MLQRSELKCAKQLNKAIELETNAVAVGEMSNQRQEKPNLSLHKRKLECSEKTGAYLQLRSYTFFNCTIFT